MLVDGPRSRRGLCTTQLVMVYGPASGNVRKNGPNDPMELSARPSGMGMSPPVVKVK